MEDHLNNNNRFIVQVISNIEQEYWHIWMLLISSSDATIVHFEGAHFSGLHYLLSVLSVQKVCQVRYSTVLQPGSPCNWPPVFV